MEHIRFALFIAPVIAGIAFGYLSAASLTVIPCATQSECAELILALEETR